MPAPGNVFAMSTEAADPSLAEIDLWPTERAIAVMLDGQRQAVAAITTQVARIAQAADAAAMRLGDTGRLAYAGAGTSGRVGVQDGVELTPTFGWPEDRLAFCVAGGERALMHAVEGAEDDFEAGRTAIREKQMGVSDVLIALAASGSTPYTLGAVEEAQALGCLTIGLACNADTPLLRLAEHSIFLDTGSEAVAGSTRMKAGTAQKAALNLLSTAIMLRQGLVYRGLMVNMRISNAKLLARATAMVADIAGVEPDQARDALEAGERDIRRAVLIALGLSPREALARLNQAPRKFAAMVEELHGR